MNTKTKLHIVFQTFCLALALHFVALNVGGIYYLKFFLPKEKVVNLLNKAETEKKTDTDSSDDVPESDDINDYNVICVVESLSLFLNNLTLNDDAYYYTLALFSSYSSRTLRGHFDVIIQPPQV
ncbi:MULTISPECIES: hypothetical protein [unclassified Arcicella]|uniref:hypothetical protein n=1 Tax=unclassified Arcicella TaxID=2644986 RepID=UPI002859C813|nr:MULTISPECIES: hypothetical protein [unclassified Arcicella]MDR6562548.1 hypothetical protein [Arcicella sp. BE51]MDR6812635.1 hypothetical protein [Arcicella sp. BE140]MDR6823947.1 hypothetical protein [Arcicella sp. BE139]